MAFVAFVAFVAFYTRAETLHPYQIDHICRPSLIEVLEIDINPDLVTSRRISRVLKKMRLVRAGQPGTGNRGWMISLDNLYLYR